MKQKELTKTFMIISSLVSLVSMAFTKYFSVVRVNVGVIILPDDYSTYVII